MGEEPPLIEMPAKCSVQCRTYSKKSKEARGIAHKRDNHKRHQFTFSVTPACSSYNDSCDLVLLDEYRWHLDGNGQPDLLLEENVHKLSVMTMTGPHPDATPEMLIRQV